MVHAQAHGDLQAAIHRHAGFPIAEPIEHLPHRLRGLGLTVGHEGENPLLTLGLHQRLEALHTEIIGGQLGLQIRQQLLRVAHRPGPRGQPLAPLLLQQHPGAHQGHVVEQQTLLLNAAAPRRHGPGADATHIGVMAAGGHEGDRLGPTGCGEQRRDQGQIGQMGAPVERVVGHHRIAGGQGLELSALHRLLQGHHALPHGTEVHRDVGGIGHQPPLPIKQSAREVEALLDVDRHAGLLQPGAHLLRDRHEAMAEQLQAHGISQGDVAAPIAIRPHGV